MSEKRVGSTSESVAFIIEHCSLSDDYCAFAIDNVASNMKILLWTKLISQRAGCLPKTLDICESRLFFCIYSHWYVQRNFPPFSRTNGFIFLLLSSRHTFILLFLSSNMINHFCHLYDASFSWMLVKTSKRICAQIWEESLATTAQLTPFWTLPPFREPPW